MGGFIAAANGRDIVGADFSPVADIEGEFFNFVLEQAGIRTDAVDQFGQGVLGNSFLAGAYGNPGGGLGLIGPIFIIDRPAGEMFHFPDFIERFVKYFSFIDFAGADQQSDSLPGERF